MDRIRFIVTVFIFEVSVTASFTPVYTEEVPSKYIFHGKEVVISTDFDNGGLARIEERETNVFDCWPYESENYRNGGLYVKSLYKDAFDNASFCFHFRISGCRNKNIVFNFYVKESINNENDESILYTNPDFPVLSYDGDFWQRMDTKSLETYSADTSWSIVTVEQKFTEDTAFVAYQYPYTNTHVERLIHRIEKSPCCTIDTIGRSTDNRDIRLIRITDPATPLSEKIVVWIIGLQHSAELGAGWGIEGMIDFLLANDMASEKARRLCLFNIIPIVNIDAVSEGKGRSHSTRNNLNRLWELDWSIPEIDSIKRTMDNWVAGGNTIDLFLDIHGFSEKNGKWIWMMPEEAYSSTLADRYKKMVEISRQNLPKAESNKLSVPGLSCNAGLRRYGAVSFCIDGFVYHGSVERTTLTSYYVSGDRLWPFEDIKACGATYVNIITNYALWMHPEIERPEVVPCMLFQNYPNPFRAGTTISFRVLSPCHVRIDICNIIGQVVRTILDETLESGTHTVEWNGRDRVGKQLQSGAYFARMHVGGDIITRKMTLVK